MVTYRPENIVNLYVWEQLKTTNPEIYNAYAQVSGGQTIIPFFPAPANNLPAIVTENDLPYIIFDKFARVRSGYKSFYPVRTDQMSLRTKRFSNWLHTCQHGLTRGSKSAPA